LDGHDRPDAQLLDDERTGVAVAAPEWAATVGRLMPTTLIGPFDTSELPRFGLDPVTVTVSRDIAPGHEAYFEAWADEVEDVLTAFPGCLGVGVLNTGAAGGRYHIVFRFVDLVALRRWERSPERHALLARLDQHVLATEVRRTVGVDHWFDAPLLVEPRRPWWRRWLGDVLWILPMALAVTFLLGPHLTMIPILPRVVLTTVLTTAFVGFVLAPARRRLRHRRHPV
jgi:antibiotic biosynthesis monooxygenase (ABM) superfamily enzyme